MNIILLTYKALYSYPLLLLKGLIFQSDELEPLFEPEPITFSFNTPAWYALEVFILSGLLYFAFLQLKKFNKNRYRREALKRISSWEYLNTSDDAQIVIKEIRILLKQLAIFKYGRQKVASLYGKDWLNFLESKGKDTPFSNYSNLLNHEALLDSQEVGQEITDLIEVSKKWIKTHA